MLGCPFQCPANVKEIAREYAAPVRLGREGARLLLIAWINVAVHTIFALDTGPLNVISERVVGEARLTVIKDGPRDRG